ncbi:snaclec agglucetin subunit beta-1-like [Glandiceps talaboti]
MLWTPVLLFLLVAYAQGDCPESWTEWNPIGGESHCYRCFTEAEPWTKADNVCRQYGGHLASVHSNNENNQIASVCPDDPELKDIWIGLNNQKNELVWEWSDHTAVEYTTWEEGEPDGESRGPFTNNINCVVQANEALLPLPSPGG